MRSMQWIVLDGIHAPFGEPLRYRALIEHLSDTVARTLVIEGQIRNMPYRYRKPVGVPERSPFDHRGHLIAERFGGPNREENLVAMHGRINMSGGAWYMMEEEIARRLFQSRSRLDLDIGVMKVAVGYENSEALRPSSFHVEMVTHLGAKSIWQISNFAPYLKSPHDPR